MDHPERRLQGLTPDHEVMTRQRLPYFIGISGQSVVARNDPAEQDRVEPYVVSAAGEAE